ncbi:hypothetical protein FHG87_014059 [Trinorchestia longiramus]|nr:hypothetical protein FHG87_014059 [Trinorchestia longiramus]
MSLVTVFGSIGANGRMQGRHNAYLGLGRIPASVREKQLVQSDLGELRGLPFLVDVGGSGCDARDRHDRAAALKILSRGNTKEKLIVRKDSVLKKQDQSPGKRKGSKSQQETNENDGSDSDNNEGSNEASSVLCSNPKLSPKEKISHNAVTKFTVPKKVSSDAVHLVKKDLVSKKTSKGEQTKVVDHFEENVIRKSEGGRLRSWWCLHCNGWRERRARHSSSVNFELATVVEWSAARVLYRVSASCRKTAGSNPAMDTSYFSYAAPCTQPAKQPMKTLINLPGSSHGAHPYSYT